MSIYWYTVAERKCIKMQMQEESQDYIMEKKKLEYYIHLAMAASGGFFGAYAVINYHNVFANAQTNNMMEIVFSLIGHDFLTVLLRGTALLVYMLGLVTSTLILRCTKWNLHMVSVLCNLCAIITLAVLPKGTNYYIALYPLFFVTAFQWNSFKGVDGYVSATIFSTNNLKQFTTSLVEYACVHDQKLKHKAKIYGTTLLAFYISAAVSCVSSMAWGVHAIFVALLPVMVSFYLVGIEAGWFGVNHHRRHVKLAGSQKSAA